MYKGDIVSASDVLSRSVVHISHISFCSGTLITQQHVLTAAHCQVSSKHRVYMDFVHKRRKRYRIKRVDTHPAHNASKVDPKTDIKILTLDVEPSELLKDGYMPVSLMWNASSLKENTTLSVYGYGLSSKLPWSSLTLRHGAVKYKKCGNRHDHMAVCTYGYHQTCSGDSGGPVVLRDSKQAKPWQIGITSMSEIGGCIANRHGYAVNLGGKASWVRNITKSHCRSKCPSTMLCSYDNTCVESCTSTVHCADLHFCNKAYGVCEIDTSALPKLRRYTGLNRSRAIVLGLVCVILVGILVLLFVCFFTFKALNVLARRRNIIENSSNKNLSADIC